MTSPRMVVAAFDFDGTITTRDAFLPFLIKAFGRVRVYRVLFSLGWEGVKVKVGLSTRDQFKDLLVGKLFPNESLARLKNIGREHALDIRDWCRLGALERIQWHKQQGHRLVMVSASLDLYLQPIVDELGFDDLLCTALSVERGVCTGLLKGANCRAAEKVSRLRQLVGPIENIELYAYGDSDGDAQMLAVSDHPAYRPFED
ncbi:MAG: HAD-IB family hydrolase [Betaproteobacteria bacterium]|nr:HAD-IB family hydrolase [Betaproteobacteria bacterium]